MRCDRVACLSLFPRTGGGYTMESFPGRALPRRRLDGREAKASYAGVQTPERLVRPQVNTQIRPTCIRSSRGTVFWSVNCRGVVRMHWDA